eukprot:1116352-Pyramimonas_sp.AAC.1
MMLKLELCNSFKNDGGRTVFKMWFSPCRRALSYNRATGSKMKGGPFSKCGSRLSAAPQFRTVSRIRLAEVPRMLF